MIGAGAHMPWEHCGAPAIADTETCPSCGVTKGQWTLQFDVTRQFTVRRGSALRLALVDAGGQGAAGAVLALAEEARRSTYLAGDEPRPSEEHEARLSALISQHVQGRQVELS